ncbi:AraC family transcriptional regulator [Sulfurimonas sp.]|uniref:helix-turn-helix domain-containing protein n=1 Tax=Sulfurimonas sp. TaxID=2022749 RepID=UPI002B45F775|nr:AraC family transcriptional regulator [Sulfurimonas sp.]
MSCNNYNVINSEKILELNNSIQEFNIDDNIYLIKSNIKFTESRDINVLSKVDGLLITINLNGSVKHKSHLSNFNLDINKNMTSINLMQTEEGINEIKAGTHLQNLHIIFKKEFLRKNFLDIDIYEKILSFFEKNENAKNIKTSNTSIQNQIIANEIFNSQYSGGLNKIFLQSKVLEIFLNEFNHLQLESNTPKNIGKVKFSSYDIEAIHKAKEIMLNNIQNPPSIKELSRSVALNDFKLKIGFKNIFNTSPYKMIHEHRMLKAKHLLETSEMNVSEIANKIGYKFVHNFSKVFLQKFGVRPKDLMKSRKYYY